MKKFFTKDYWKEEQTQPRWYKWFNELGWVIIVLQLLSDDE